MSTSCERIGRPVASTSTTFFNSRPGASLASSEPASAMVSRARANAEGFAAVILTRLPFAPAAGLASAGFAGFASAGFAAFASFASFASAGLPGAALAGPGFPSAGFAAAGAAPGAGGAARATATKVPKETVTDNAKPSRNLVIDSPVFRARQYHERSPASKAASRQLG